MLLVQLQPFEAAFHAAAADAAADGDDSMQQGTHSPEGVPDALRQEAGGHEAVLGAALPLVGLLLPACKPLSEASTMPRLPSLQPR